MPGGGPRYEPRASAPPPETLVLEERLARVDEVVAHRTRSVVVVLDRLEDHFNMAAVLRTCEGLGIQEVHVIDNPAERFVPNAAVTQGCDKWLDIATYDGFAACREALKARGFAIWASAVTPTATPLDDLRFDGKVALVFGNERFGVSEDVLQGADGLFWIPMAGFTRSLNISAAAAATVTQALRWRRQHVGPVGDLSPQETAQLRTRFCTLSVKQRKKLYKGRLP
jgi:tRNA (guanosine-2'-O-)-methyltransferase